MATLTPERSSHVPAWKKLGLKLKYAKEDAGLRSTDADKLENGVNGLPNTREKVKGKRRRLDDEDKDEQQAAGEELAHKTKKNKKEKKRVSFSADTKDRDGDDESGDREEGGVSVSNGGELDFSAHVSTEKNQDGPAEKKEKKKKKKEKGSRKDNASKDLTSAHIHEAPILSYLSHYHKNRAAWKFQKNRETQLFKSIFSLEQVPTQYNAALLAYLQGLKSEGARRRLYQAAEEVVKGDLEPRQSGEGENGDATATNELNEGGNENGTNTEVYGKTVEAFRTWLLESKEDFDISHAAGGLDDDARARFEKRHRAELVLFAVQGRLFSLEKPKPVPESKHGKGEQGRKKVSASKKKRKNRTAVVDISSSSESESESESSSDSDSDATSSSGSSSS